MTKKHMAGPNEPMAVAAELIGAYKTADGHLTLRHWRGDWLRWQGSYWELDEDATRKALLYKGLANATYTHITKKADGTKTTDVRDWQPNRRKIADVMDALAATVHLPASVESPSWIDTDGPTPPAGEIVACRNGLLHVPTRKLMPATPCFFSRVAVPFDYDPDASDPKKWLDFLDQLWPTDLDDEEQAKANADAIKTLQEFFGYILSGRTDHQKILTLIGPTRGGKGVAARTLGNLVGHGNVAAPTLPSLATNFGLQPLIGKPLALVSDARIDGINTSQIAERLLSISGEDSVTIDRKYMPTWTGKLPTRFVVLSNELPRFGDASAAIAHRFVILPLQNSFLGKENPNLTDELRDELPGILLWALDGLDRLSKNGRFTRSKSSADATLELVNIASPVTAFVRDECERGPEKSVVVKDLFDAWKEWCEDGDHKAGDVQKFGRDLRAVVPGLKRVRPREGASRVPTFTGIGLNPKGALGAADELGRDESADVSSQHHNAEVRDPSRPKPVTSENAEAVTRPNDDESQPGPGGPRWAATNPIVEPTKTVEAVEEQLTVPGTPPIEDPPAPTTKPARVVRPKCQQCRRSLPKGSRADRKFCSRSCEQKAYRQRQKTSG